MLSCRVLAEANMKYSSVNILAQDFLPLSLLANEIRPSCWQIKSS